MNFALFSIDVATAAAATAAAEAAAATSAATEVVGAAPATETAAAAATTPSTMGAAAAAAGTAARSVMAPPRADGVGEVNLPRRRQGLNLGLRLQLQAQASILGAQARELAEVAGNRHRFACHRQAQCRSISTKATR